MAAGCSTSSTTRRTARGALLDGQDGGSLDDVVGRLRRVAAWEVRLAAPDFVLGAWDDGGPEGLEASGPDRITRLPWFSYSAEGRRLLADLAALIEVFDWMAWARTPRGAELMRAPEAIGSASLEELRRVVTVVVRGDRFTEGNVSGAHERGFLAAIARRAGELAATVSEGGQAAG